MRRLILTTALLAAALTPAADAAGKPIAIAEMGKVPNAALLGGFAAMTGLITLPSVVAAIRERFPARIAEGNASAATEAFELTRSAMAEAAHATAD